MLWLIFIYILLAAVTFLQHPMRGLCYPVVRNQIGVPLALWETLICRFTACFYQ